MVNIGDGQKGKFFVFPIYHIFYPIHILLAVFWSPMPKDPHPSQQQVSTNQTFDQESGNQAPSIWKKM